MPWLARVEISMSGKPIGDCECVVGADNLDAIRRDFLKRIVRRKLDNKKSIDFSIFKLERLKPIRIINGL